MKTGMSSIRWTGDHHSIIYKINNKTRHPISGISKAKVRISSNQIRAIQILTRVISNNLLLDLALTSVILVRPHQLPLLTSLKLILTALKLILINIFQVIRHQHQFSISTLSVWNSRKFRRMIRDKLGPQLISKMKSTVRNTIMMTRGRFWRWGQTDKYTAQRALAPTTGLRMLTIAPRLLLKCPNTSEASPTICLRTMFHRSGTRRIDKEIKIRATTLRLSSMDTLLI